MFRTSLLFFLIFFIKWCYPVTQDDIGVKVIFTQPGLSELLLIVDQTLSEFASEKEPFHIDALPPIIKTDAQLNVTNVTLIKTSHDSLAGYIIPGSGLQAVMKGISADLTFNMSYKIKQGRFTIAGKDYVELKISQTEISLTANISMMDDGNPLVNITNMTISIGSFDFQETGDWEQLAPTIAAMLEEFLETQAPAMISDKVNVFLSNLTSQLQLEEIPLTPGTAVNLTLTNNPYTTDSLTMVADLRGFAYIRSDSIYGFFHGCASPMINPIDTKYSFGSRMLQIALSDQVANCLAETLFVSRQLNLLVQKVFHELIDGISPGPMQEGLELVLSSTLPPTISSSSKTGITIDIPAKLTWVRSPPIYPVAQPYISLHTNLTVTAMVKIQDARLYINITSARLLLGTAYISPSMPERWQEQVESTEWDKLNFMANKIISNLLPTLNGLIGEGFELPSIPTERVTFGLADLAIHDGYIVISTSFVGKDK